MNPNPPVPSDPRTRTLNGLRDLVAFLDAHPKVPAPRLITVELHARSDADGAEQIARIAHHLAVKPVTAPNGTQRASRTFGLVTFAAVYHPISPAVAR